MNYKSFKIELCDKLKGEFAFSSNNNNIRILSSLLSDVDEDNNNIFEEAIFARNYYKDKVDKLKSNKEKVSPGKVKQDALTKAKEHLISLIGQEEYSRLHAYKISKPVSNTDTSKPVSNTNLVDSSDSNLDISSSNVDLLDMEALKEEFDFIDEDFKHNPMNNPKLDKVLDSARLPGLIKEVKDLSSSKDLSSNKDFPSVQGEDIFEEAFADEDLLDITDDLDEYSVPLDIGDF